MRDPLETPEAHSSIVRIQKQSNPMQRPFHILNYGQEAGGGQKLMIVHLHKKKKKCFFRIILIALSLVKQFVQTLTVQSEEWVTSAFQYCLWEVEGVSSPHHKSLSTLGCLDRQWQSSQKVLYCEWSLSESEHYPLQKEQKSDQHVGFPCPERQRVSIQGVFSFSFLQENRK